MEILGIPIDNVTRESAVKRLELFLKGGRPRFVTTPNPEMIVHAFRDVPFRKALQKSDLAIPDGTGIVWASRLLGSPMPERVTGTDIVDDLAALAAEKGYSMFFLGGTDGRADAAAQALKAKYRDLRVAGCMSGGVVAPDGSGGYRLDGTVRDSVTAAAPDILLVAFGHGKQERWLEQHLGQFPSVKVGIGIGGAFDFIAGAVPRAPLWMRRRGLEWLYRLSREPQRLCRIVNAVFVFPYLVLRYRKHDPMT